MLKQNPTPKPQISTRSTGLQNSDLIGFVDAFGQRVFEELDYVAWPICVRAKVCCGAKDTAYSGKLHPKPLGSSGIYRYSNRFQASE